MCFISESISEKREAEKFTLSESILLTPTISYFTPSKFNNLA